MIIANVNEVIIMLMNKAIRYRAYPTEQQKEFFMKNFGCCRKIWNLMLNDKIEYYKQNGKMLYNTPAMYKEMYPFLKEVDSLALANVQLDLQNAYNAFFSNKKIGFPKYKSRKYSKLSYTTNNQKTKTGFTIKIVDNEIRLPKIKFVKIKKHREPKVDWKIKSATINMEKDGKFYVSVLFEYNKDIVKSNGQKAIGLDYKSDGLYMDSNHKCCNMEKYYKKSQKRLKKLQQKLSRKLETHIIRYDKNHRPIYDKELKECKNVQKARLKVAKLSSHVANQRKDFLHKKSFEIANQYDVVCVEDLSLKGIGNKHSKYHLGKSMIDNGYGIFLKFLEYKLYDRGKILVKVSKKYPSSQICSQCGHKHKLELYERVYKCSHCGLEIDRDYNSALNILHEGLRMLE